MCDICLHNIHLPGCPHADETYNRIYSDYLADAARLQTMEEDLESLEVALENTSKIYPPIKEEISKLLIRQRSINDELAENVEAMKERLEREAS